jgi:hypothetical protein
VKTKSRQALGMEELIAVLIRFDSDIRGVRGRVRLTSAINRSFTIHENKQTKQKIKSQAETRQLKRQKKSKQEAKPPNKKKHYKPLQTYHKWRPIGVFDVLIAGTSASDTTNQDNWPNLSDPWQNRFCCCYKDQICSVCISD